MKTKTRNKKGFLLLACGAAIASLGAAALRGTPVLRADAGQESKQIIDESFSSAQLNNNYWLKYDETDVIELAPEVNSFSGLNILHAQGGSGLISAQILRGGARLEVNIGRYEAPEGGWLALNFGTMITGTDFIEYDNLDKGKVFFLVYAAGKWSIFSHASFSLDFTDSEGTPLKINYDYDGEGNVTVRQFELPAGSLPANGVIENSRVIMQYGGDGKVQLSVQDNESGVSTVLAKTDKALEYPVGRVGCSFTGTSENVGNAYIKDMQVVDLSGETEQTVAKIKPENYSPLSDFLQYISPLTGAFFYGRESQLAFTKQTGNNGMLTYMVPMDESDAVEKDNFVLESVVRVEELVGDKRFGVVYGLSSYSDFYKTEGTGYVYLTKGGSGVSIGAVTYDGSGNERTLLAETALSAAVNPEEFTLEITCDKDLTTTVRADGAVVASFEGVAYGGYFGYALGGGATSETNYAHVYVDDVKGWNKVYSTPRNADLFADFENEYLNIAEWRVSDYGGNIRQKSTGTYIVDGKMYFDNVNQNAHLTTVPQFSNFKMNMEISDLQTTPEFDEYGMSRPASSWFGFMYGVPEKPSDWTSKDQYRAHYSYPNLFSLKRCPMVTFSANDINADGYIDENSPTYLRLYNVSLDAYPADAPANWTAAGGYLSITLDEKYNIFSQENADKTVEIQAEMTDGVLVISIRYKGEADWYEACRFNTGTAPVGCISLRGYGTGNATCASSFKVDNLSIVNTDEGKLNTVDYGEENNKRAPTPDYEYVSVLNKENLLKGETLKIGIAGAAAAAFTAAAAVAYVVAKKRG